MIVDHIGHLKQWKILPGGKRAGTGTIQFGLKFFCFSNLVAALSQIKKFLASAGSEDGRREELMCLKAAFKHLLLALQSAHLSLLYPTHDALVGVAGMVTSGMDLRAQWPAGAPVIPKTKAGAALTVEEKGGPKSS
mmetsp:Transcript_115077/g.320061  ORF Transcript_115077/g.320061 Transcript_115077/m.320061 type:complete len:136 (-) Transcript_115077:131-538(-)